jgi:SAM-dependent methyltransferase
VLDVGRRSRASHSAHTARHPSLQLARSVPPTAAPSRAVAQPAVEPERLDQGVPPEEAATALRDLERVYRLLLAGGRELRRLVLDAQARSGGAKPWCLDVGCGGGHVGADLVRDARRRGRTLKVVGVDAKLSHLLAGRRSGSPQLPVVALAEALPLRDGALACAFSHLFFHHFDEAGNRRVLGEMRRVAATVVVVDLQPSRIARWLVRPGLRLLRLGAVAYHDGVTSVVRSYSLDAVAATVAGMPVVEMRKSFPFRWVLVLAGGSAARLESPGTRSPC